MDSKKIMATMGLAAFLGVSLASSNDSSLADWGNDVGQLVLGISNHSVFALSGQTTTSAYEYRVSENSHLLSADTKEMGYGFFQQPRSWQFSV